MRTLLQMESDGKNGAPLHRFALAVAGEAAEDGDVGDATIAVAIANSSAGTDGSTPATSFQNGNMSYPMGTSGTTSPGDSTSFPGTPTAGSSYTDVPEDGNTSFPNGNMSYPMGTSGTTSPDDSTSVPGTATARISLTSVPDNGNTSFPNGNESNYQADMNQGNTLSTQFDSALDSNDPALIKKAEQGYADLADLRGKAAGDATSIDEKDNALSRQANDLVYEATLMANSGKAGPGGAQHDQYDLLMNKAIAIKAEVVADGGSAADGAAAADTDFNVLKSEVDAGRFNSSDYKNAYNDWQSDSPTGESGNTTGGSGNTGVPGNGNTSFPGGDETAFKANIQSAQDLEKKADGEKAKAQNEDPKHAAMDNAAAQKDYAAAAAAARNAASEATNEQEKLFALSVEGSNAGRSAELLATGPIAVKGDPTPKSAFDDLMTEAHDAYNAIANDPALAGNPDITERASSLASDFDTMKKKVDDGEMGSPDYASAKKDFDEGVVAWSF
ncbi:hypothetical protein [Bradyrhizobium sp. Tv2a-2]|uniref:hypothetical protein n=1 Tax=Bradyrhizobium sp. Tv2a-2 TaxID=113395 RepID=UPI0003F80C51|nr:hypothetical protein [Bradyrhizobium sp. Tv2a-2]